MPTIPIRWADNTKDLVANLKSGLSQIEATRASADKLARSLGGDNLVRAAHSFAAAIEKLGGVQNLTASNQARVNSVMTRAVEVLNAAGKGSSDLAKHFQSLADASASVGQKTSVLSEFFGGFFKQFTAAMLVDRAVSSLVDWGREAIASAGHTLDLANKLGVSTDAIQRWEQAGAKSGVTAEQFADAAFKLGVRLAGGSGSVKQALEDLAKASGDVGISWQALRGLPLEQKLQIINEALEKITDSDERNRIGVELYGKSFSGIAAAVADGYTKIAREATVTERAQLEALDRMSEAWDQFVKKQQKHLQAWLGSQVTMVEQSKKLTKEQQAALDEILSRSFFTGPAEARKFLLGLAENESERAKPQPPGPKPIPPAFSVELAKARAEVAALTAEERRQIAAAEALGKSTDDITNRFGISEAALRVLNDQTRAAAEASRKAATEREKEKKETAALYEHIRQLEVIMPGLRQAVGELDTTELKAIETWLAKGKAAEDLTKKTEALYDAVRKLEQVKAGEIDISNLPSGTVDTETIARLKLRLGIDEGAFQRTQTALGALSQSIGMLGSISDGAFGKVANLTAGFVDGIANMLRAVETFKDASLSSMISIGAVAFQLGIIIGQLLAPLLRSVFTGPGAIGDAARRAAQGAAARVGHAATGGIVTNFGIQRFAYGGPVMSLSAPSTDTVPAMLTPGEWVLNKQQQRDIFGGGGTTVINNHWAGVIMTPDVYRDIARKSLPHTTQNIAENKGGSYSRMRSGLGLRS